MLKDVRLCHKKGLIVKLTEGLSWIRRNLIDFLKKELTEIDKI